MGHRDRQLRHHGLRPRALMIVVTAAAAMGALLAIAGPANAAVPPPGATASDPRATMVTGNVMTCAQLGLTGMTRLGTDGGSPAADAYVVATVRDDRYVDVTVTPAGALAGVVVNAIVVKGGDGYNLYTDPAVLPPTLPAPQGYLSPFAGSGNVPQISHWFVCYSFAAVPVGSLMIDKDVLPPDGISADALPLGYTAHVECDSPGFVPVDIAFGRGGGVGQSAGATVIAGLPVGTVCTVTELNTGSFPAGTSVTFSPSSTVTIGPTEGVHVTVINDFSGVALLSGTLGITKTVEAPAGTAPASFVIDYGCTDGTAGEVTLPGTGGTAPPVTVQAGAFCLVAENAASIPAGWTVAYTGDGVVVPDGAVARIAEAGATVTIVNTAPSAVDPAADELAASGASDAAALAFALFALATGVIAIRVSGRRRAG